MEALPESNGLAAPSSVRILVGDVRAGLATLPSESVQTCVTSVPYWGLRSYGTKPQVWGQTCYEHPHEWGDLVRAPWANEVPGPNTGGKNHARNMTKAAGAFCTHVHEWGLAHTAGWHVGTATGVATSTLARSAAEAQARNKETITGNSMGQRCDCGAWLGELGLEPTPGLYVEHIIEVFRHVWRVLRKDGTLWLNIGFSYAGSGKGPSNSLQPDASQLNKGKRNSSQFANGQAPTAWLSVPRGYKPKDLIPIPWLVAMALQQEGWTLRSCIPWLKRNSMPESVTDRPATAVEYVFLLSKSRTYYWDADAVRVKIGEPTRRNAEFRGVSVYKDHIADRVGNSAPRPEGKSSPGPKSMEGRNRRNSDWFFESWQGLLLDEDDDPLALVVNPQPFTGSHFATFPPKLVEPMILAGSRPGDTVLDPFAGAATTLMVAAQLGRDSVGIELKPEYAQMGAERIRADGGFMVDVSMEELP